MKKFIVSIWIISILIIGISAYWYFAKPRHLYEERGDRMSELRPGDIFHHANEGKTITYPSGIETFVEEETTTYLK